MNTSIEQLKEMLLNETAIPKSAFDYETSGLATSSFPSAENRIDNPEQDLLDSFRVYMQTVEQAIEKRSEWRRENQRQLSEEEELMDWFIYCKNKEAGNDEPNAQRLKIHDAVFSITKKTIGFDLPTVNFDFSSLYKRKQKLFNSEWMLPLEPIKIDKGISLKDSLAQYPLTVTDPEKMYIMPTIL